MADALVTTIKSLITLLESFKVPVYRQGSMEQEATYPDTFITWWNNQTPDHAHYDNTDYGSELDFNVYVYSADPERTYTLLSEIRTELKKNGWIPTSQGFDTASDEPTHTGTRNRSILSVSSHGFGTRTGATTRTGAGTNTGTG